MQKKVELPTIKIITQKLSYIFTVVVIGRVRKEMNERRALIGFGCSISHVVPGKSVFPRKWLSICANSVFVSCHWFRLSPSPSSTKCRQWQTSTTLKKQACHCGCEARRGGGEHDAENGRKVNFCWIQRGCFVWLCFFSFRFACALSCPRHKTMGDSPFFFTYSDPVETSEFGTHTDFGNIISFFQELEMTFSRRETCVRV